MDGRRRRPPWGGARRGRGRAALDVDHRAGRGHPYRQGVEPGGARPPARPGGGARRADQRRRHDRRRAGPPGGRRGRRRAGPGRGPGPAARRADDDQGQLLHRRHAHHLGRARADRPRARRGRLPRRPPAPGRGGRLRQDEPAHLRRRPAELQRDLRHHQQPLRSLPHAGRLVRRLGRRAGLRFHPPRAGLGHRGLDPLPVPHVGCGRPQAHLRDRARPRPDPRSSGHAHPGRPGGRRAHGPHRRRPGAGSRRHDRPRPLEPPRLAPRAASTPADAGSPTTASPCGRTTPTARSTPT